MCGRFVLYDDEEMLAGAFSLDPRWFRGVPARYNIAPGTAILGIVQPSPDGTRETRLFKWGLVPHWAKDPAIGNRMINARAESVHEKPAYRGPFKYRRCLVPARGFFEWTQEGGKRRPHYIHPTDGKPFAMAALWDEWSSPDGSPLETCSILTTEARGPIAALHHRMPVILQPGQYPTWLDASIQHPTPLLELIAGTPTPDMRIHPVDPRVNKPDWDQPQNIMPIEAETPDPSPAKRPAAEDSADSHRAPKRRARSRRVADGQGKLFEL